MYCIGSTYGAYVYAPQDSTSLLSSISSLQIKLGTLMVLWNSWKKPKAALKYIEVTKVELPKKWHTNANRYRLSDKGKIRAA